MASVIQIKRTAPRDGVAEYPVKERHGYVLGSPKHGNKKHHLANEVYAMTLDEAAALVEAGHSLRMGRPGKRPSMICPASLRIIRS